MELNQYLSTTDSERAVQVLHKLARHDISRWALTGGFAIELHIQSRRGRPSVRRLNDIDFLVDSFDCITKTLGREFLFRHVHPFDPPAKTLMQSVDPEMGVRVDVFRAYGREMDRAEATFVAGFPMMMVSLLDMVVRHARLNWDLVDGKQVHPKYSRDFLRMLELVITDEVEGIWREHRKPHMPEGFADTVRELRRVIEVRRDLLVAWDYSEDALEVCTRCQSHAAFPLAEASRIFALLGYF
ncbi:MAG: hypothetical protein WBX22_21965 [Silvibacterium sp.]